MQKLMVCLARPEGSDRSAWNEAVRAAMQRHEHLFSACGYACVDEDVAPAHLLEMRNTAHPADALLSSWSENFYHLDGYFADLAELGGMQAYSVAESAAISLQSQPGRVAGMCQVALIKKPQALQRADWIRLWLGEHTQIAIDTQSTFGYRQNIVTVPLPLSRTEDSKWPLMDAIVEENFPAMAMTSREAFFNCEGDPEKFERHQQIMLQSCFRFIDFDAFDCVPMSQYIL